MITFPYILGGIIAAVALKKRKAPRPGAASSASHVSPESNTEGQYNRNGQARPVLSSRRRNCARCVIS